ncbi:hypothetical protein JCM10212_002553 [Sporobolomyces blumeae]
MHSTTSLLALACAALASFARASPLDKRLVEVDGFYNPTSNGGRWLTLARNTYPEGLGEPINVVVSSDSDGLIMTDTGFFDWSQSIQFSGECLGSTGSGAKQAANLGDGLGFINQTILLRENFGDLSVGTCRETVQGGYHYRVWRQNGTEANSGAWFLAASEEEPLAQQHMITDNGYDIGRDQVVSRATVAGGTISPLTNRTFVTTVTNVSGQGYFADVTTSEINHGISTDGIVAVLTVKITSNGTQPNIAIGASGPTGAKIGSASSVFPISQVATLGLFSLLALGLLL